MSGEARTESESRRLRELEAEYELLGELGRGGTAVVYLAQDRELGRKVAIKVIRSTYVDDPEIVARVIREAKTVAALQHPKIVTLFGTRRLGDDSVALVMQYVPGLSLREIVRRDGRASFELATTVLRDIGEALAYAHRQRIVHRDVKPDNIHFDREAGHARLSDFGIARPWDSASEFTIPGMSIGTPAYMSPEQIDGEELDGRSDLYSLGLVGYEMLAGEAPWAGENVYGTIFKQKHEALPRLEDRRPGVPGGLALAIRGCLAKDRDRRWRDVDQFLEVLDGRRPADAAPLAPGAWRDLGESRDGEGPAPGRDGNEAVVEDAATMRFRRAAEGSPPASEERETPEEPAAAPAPEGGSPARGARRVGALVAVLLGVLAVAGGTALYHLGPEDLAERALTSFRSLPLPGVRQDAAADPVESGGGLEPSEAPPLPLPPTEGPGREPAPAPSETRPPVGPPAELSVLSGADQVGAAGEILPVPITVALRDSAGVAVSGVTVDFAVVGGGGEVIPASVSTNAAGIAEARWRLGAGGGEQRVVASVEGRPSVTAAIDAAANPREPAQVALVSGAGQVSQPAIPLPTPIRVRVMDELGNPIPDAEVVFRPTNSGGSVTPSSATTNGQGIAQVRWTVGRRIGPDTLLGYIPGEDRPALAVVADVIAPRLSPRPMVAAGGTHTCVLRGSGQASCWGANGSGQLGDGGTERQVDAARVITGVRFARLAAGVSFTCGLSVEHRAYCWGANESGQLGIGSEEPRATPEAVATDARFGEVGAGAAHACGVAIDGRILCWGSNEFGQLGDGTDIDRMTPTEVSVGRRFRAVAVGWGHTCALDREGRAYCWGRNSSGELGDGTGRSRSLPAEIAGERRYVALAAGSAHSCALSGEGELYCWGQDSYGQLGIGGGENRPVPVAVDAAFAITDVVAGAVHTCALSEDGQAFCWGRNAYGQLGDGTNVDRSAPARVSGGSRFTDLSTRGAHTCGTTVGGITRCWGYNSDGQLGDGTRSTSPVPVGSGDGGP